ncbi:MAG: hypothetical protein LBN03_00040 [Bifidobacteriaceae bacterium]|jgi:tetratricopeptide (TPR) repeat protein|nr:hypothetical protein [Bifidobacteriaceae bacterium]
MVTENLEENDSQEYKVVNKNIKDLLVDGEFPIPEIPDYINISSVDNSILSAFHEFSDGSRDKILKHMLAATELMNTDNETSVYHAVAAARMAPRVANAREISGLAAYYYGDYKYALQEFTAAHRLNDSISFVPFAADCFRALGEREKAIALISKHRKTDIIKYEEYIVESTIIETECKFELGLSDEALKTINKVIRHKGLATNSRIRLQLTKADIMEHLGEDEKAKELLDKAYALNNKQQNSFDEYVLVDIEEDEEEEQELLKKAESRTRDSKSHSGSSRDNSRGDSRGGGRGGRDSERDGGRDGGRGSRDGGRDSRSGSRPDSKGGKYGKH